MALEAGGVGALTRLLQLDVPHQQAASVDGEVGASDAGDGALELGPHVVGTHRGAYALNQLGDVSLELLLGPRRLAG